jgi:hypothetical protein
MDSERQDPRNTREFVALWNEAKGEHLGHRVDEVLDALSRRGVLPVLTSAQREMLAHALQLAGDPGAGPSTALQYLETCGSRPSGNPPGI